MASVETAVALGHELEDDSPWQGQVARLTCRRCGRAVLRCGTNVYGSATEKRCVSKEAS